MPLGMLAVAFGENGQKMIIIVYYSASLATRDYDYYIVPKWNQESNCYLNPPLTGLGVFIVDGE